MLHFNTHSDFKSLVDDLTDANDIAQRLEIFDPKNLTTDISETLKMWWERIDKKCIELDLSTIDRLYYLKQWNCFDFLTSRLLFRMDLKNQQQQQQRYVYVILRISTKESRRCFGYKFISYDAYSLVRLIPWLESDYPKRRRIYELLAKDGIWDNKRPEYSFHRRIRIRTKPVTLTQLCYETVCQNRKRIPRQYYISLLPPIFIDSLDTFNERMRFSDKLDLDIIDFLAYDWDEWNMVKQQTKQYLNDDNFE